ncbi:hypothetical protein SCHPADRAFT_509517 [Schizopora paradoxa]|uniref:GPI inositol-deacylase n=1 Tax=Schizopora paradoxa TaxID=27342 RepID=A0A0H2RMF6_9AGAM|nr:hypothetical protein SCHPADRAFT_509517 [Schizopora paradoxa]
MPTLISDSNIESHENHFATLTVNISGIADSTTDVKLKDYFSERELKLSDEHGPITFTKPDGSADKKRTTITFNNEETFKRAISLGRAQRKLDGFVLEFDHKFLGFTTFSGGTEVDIVALHGMNGHAFSSFEYREEDYSFMWLRDALPARIPGARVMVYGYDAHVISDVSVGRIRTYAETFMQKLRHIRKNTDRPLILIGHALGGLVIKQALILPNAAGLFDPIVNSVRAVIFMSTPHQGMKGVEDPQFIANFFGASGANFRRDLIAEQDAKTVVLFDLTNDFKELIREKKITVRTLYETRKTGVEGLGSVSIIDEQSSRLGVAGEQARGLDADHLNICKFDSSSEALSEILKITEELVKAQDLPPAYLP